MVDRGDGRLAKARAVGAAALDLLAMGMLMLAAVDLTRAVAERWQLPWTVDAMAAAMAAAMSAWSWLKSAWQRRGERMAQSG